MESTSESESKILLKTYFNKSRSGPEDCLRLVDIPHESCPDKMFSCSFCNEGYCSETELEMHENRSHRKNTFNDKDGLTKGCGLCLRTFKSRQSARKHYSQIHLHASPKTAYIDKKIYICDYCDSIFYNRKLMRVHFSIKHGVENDNRCIVCKKTYKSAMKAHLLYQHGLNRVSTCPVCLVHFESQYVMETHMGEEHVYKKRNMDNYEAGNRIYVTKYANVVDRYFIAPKKRSRAFPCSLVNGTTIHSSLHVCVICRGICINDISKFHHMVRCHDLGADSFEGIQFKIVDHKKRYMTPKVVKKVVQLVRYKCPTVVNQHRLNPRCMYEDYEELDSDSRDETGEIGEQGGEIVDKAGDIKGETSEIKFEEGDLGDEEYVIDLNQRNLNVSVVINNENDESENGPYMIENERSDEMKLEYDASVNDNNSLESDHESSNDSLTFTVIRPSGPIKTYSRK